MSRIRYLAMLSEEPMKLAGFYAANFGLSELGRSSAGDVSLTDGGFNFTFLRPRPQLREPHMTIGLHHLGIAVDDIDADSAAVVLHGKGGKQRIVPVGSFALRAIEDYLVRSRPVLASRGKGTPALFLNARGGALSRQSAWTILQAAAERAGLTVTVSPHTMRHSYATHLLDGGADVRVVQELLGHASVTTTQVYTLVTVDRLREVYATAHPRAR